MGHPGAISWDLNFNILHWCSIIVLQLQHERKLHKIITMWIFWLTKERNLEKCLGWYVEEIFVSENDHRLKYNLHVLEFQAPVEVWMAVLRLELLLVFSLLPTYYPKPWCSFQLDTSWGGSFQFASIRGSLPEKLKIYPWWIGGLWPFPSPPHQGCDRAHWVGLWEKTETAKLSNCMH